jgi:hypothetical protein
MLIKRIIHPAPNRFGFAAVHSLLEDHNPLLMSLADAFEHGCRLVTAAIVHKDKDAVPLVRIQEFLKLGHAQTRALVVAWHHNRRLSRHSARRRHLTFIVNPR